MNGEISKDELSFTSASSRLCAGKAKLDRFIIEHFQQPARELPESLLTEHRIILNLGSLYTVEQWYDGCYQQNQMDTGNFTILPIGMSRRVIWDRPIEFLLLELDPVYVQQTILDLSDRHLELVPHYKCNDCLIHQIGLALKTELQSQGLGGKLYLESMMATLTVQLLRHHAHWRSIAQSSLGGLSKYQLRQVIDYISSNLDQKLSLNELASIAQTSNYYLIRLFKQSMGVTLHRYVTTCRIEKAKQLLQERNLSIVEICHLVGFGSQSHFTYLFHRYVGVTPKVYRDSL